VVEAAKPDRGTAPLTVAELLALHPWPDDWAKQKRIERLWTFDLPG
jgi:hypothetical protein